MRNLLLLLVLLSGCKVVTPNEMRRAEAACKAHRGLSHIRVSPFAEFFWAYCHDGTEISRLPESGRRGPGEGGKGVAGEPEDSCVAHPAARSEQDDREVERQGANHDRPPRAELSDATAGSREAVSNAGSEEDR